MIEISSQHDSNLGEQKKISVMVVDDHPLMRQALRSVLEKEADFKVVAEVDTGEEAVNVATTLLPDVIIMDISMPGLNGLEATRQIKAKCPSVAILVLTIHSDSEHILSLLEAGAAGYLIKSAFGEEVVQSVRAIAAGETVLSPAVSELVVKHALRLSTKPFFLAAGEKLTEQELKIMKLAARGMSNKDIAQTLNVSERTVKGYLVNIFSKLRVGSRTQAVITGLRTGFLTLDDLE